MSVLTRLIAAGLPAVPAPIIRRVASRYVAGESLDEALAAVVRLNAGGASATMDVLGEDVTRAEETRFFVDEYLRALTEIGRRGIDSNVSIKLTALGLKFDPSLAEANVREIAVRAAETNNFVRIDMEDSSVTQATIDVFRRVRGDFPNTGIVLQAYLRRTQDDVASAIEEGWSVRLCKGIYVEPPEIAYRDPDLVRRNYAQAADRLLAAGSRVGLATHDEAMVLEALASIARHRPDANRYEFQMLLGVAAPLRRVLIGSGHHLRVYVPFGKAWRAYSLRRLNENPAIVRHIIRGIVKGEEAF